MLKPCSAVHPIGDQRLPFVQMHELEATGERGRRSLRAEAMRVAYFALGLLCLGIGLLGAVLPGLPGTPFMLIALWAFARSSQRFHDWLYNHPWFGPGLRRFMEHRVIPTRVKIVAIGCMAGAVVASIASGLPLWATGVLVGVSIAGSIYISLCPSSMPKPADRMGADEQERADDASQK